MHSAGAGASANARFWNLFFRPGEWLLLRFCRLDKAQWPILWIAGLFLVQTIPATIIRASNLEEGRIIAIARGALEDGHWITPFVYGQRFAERPVLLSWIAALFGEVGGSVTLWSLRIPHLCFFLAGTMMIYTLIRLNAGKSAAIFGALCWISMPVVAPKFINSEPDIVLSTLLFAAFYLWWIGSLGGRPSWQRWLCIGLLLGLAGLAKGPQPVAYFSLGVGAYLLIKARDQIPAFFCANVLAGLMVGSWYALVYRGPSDAQYWAEHSRLLTMTGFELVLGHLDFVKNIAVETLPAPVLLAPAAALALERWRSTNHDLILATLLYALICTLALLVWPGGITSRYAMPATMALAVICGLMFDRYRKAQPRLVVSALVVVYLIFGGLLVRGWIVMPLRPELFKQSEIAGRKISSILEQNGASLLYVIGISTEPNMLVYVPRVRAVTLADLQNPDSAPIFAALRPDEEETLARLNPGLNLDDLAKVGPNGDYRVVRIGSRQTLVQSKSLPPNELR